MANNLNRMMMNYGGVPEVIILIDGSTVQGIISVTCKLYIIHLPFQLDHFTHLD